MKFKGQKMAWLRLHTFRQRLILIFGVCMLGCFLLVVAVSHITLQAAEKNRVETTMKADLVQLTDLIDNEYYTLVQMSQQMTSEGIIGETMSLYLEADEPFERIRLSSDVTTSINTMIFSHKNVSLVGYLRLNEGDGASVKSEALFSSMTVDEGVDPESLPTLMETDTLELQAPHESLNAITNREVISLTRPVQFSNGTRLVIYIESYLDPEENLESLSEIRGIPYELLEQNGNGKVLYSTCGDFSAGSTLENPVFPKEVVGQIGSYNCVWAPSKFGFTHLLLVPAVHYNKMMSRWMMSIAGVFLLALAMTAFTAFSLIYLIYKPLQALRRGMEEVGRGDFRPGHYDFHMDEFNTLFQRFDDMKQEISGLLENSRQQEKEKQQLEIDKLYYQINPHFLMNALNSAHWMAVANHQPEIDRFIYQLNYILGYSLGKTDKRATFRTELKSLEMYLGLQKERYDFEVWMDVEKGDYLDYPCARLILQPLAENAVCHNLNEFGNLWISMHPVELEGKGWVEILLCDDGRGIQGLGAGGTEAVSQLNKGIGLRYVQMILESHYGGAAHIGIESEEGRGTTVRLLLPIRKEDGKCTTC